MRAAFRSSPRSRVLRRASRFLPRRLRWRDVWLELTPFVVVRLVAHAIRRPPPCACSLRALSTLGDASTTPACTPWEGFADGGACHGRSGAPIMHAVGSARPLGLVRTQRVLGDANPPTGGHTPGAAAGTVTATARPTPTAGAVTCSCCTVRLGHAGLGAGASMDAVSRRPPGWALRCPMSVLAVHPQLSSLATCQAVAVYVGVWHRFCPPVYRRVMRQVGHLLQQVG